MPRLKLETFVRKKIKGKWKGKAPDKLYCPKCKGVMEKGAIIRRDFVSGYGVTYSCSRGYCNYEESMIVNSA